MMYPSRKVAVVSANTTKFGKIPEKTSKELFAAAANEALKDGGLSVKDIDAIYVGNFMGELAERQGHMGPLFSDVLGRCNLPTMRVESACASSGVAFRVAYMAVASGFYDTVLVGGVEKMSTLDTPMATTGLAMAADACYEVSSGITFPGLYAMMARAHMHKYGTTEEQLAMVAVKNHQNALNNPMAQFHRKITVEEVLTSPPIATPLKLYDCCPLSDGASAAILVSEEKAKEFDDSIFVIGSGHASDYIALHDREDLTRIRSAELAAKQAYKQAGIEPKDIDLAEVHDCFTIAEIIATEGLGFFQIGAGGQGVQEGETKIDGKVPINTSGGLKAKGHPVGATGVAQVAEIFKQLNDKAGKNQVKDAEKALTHNVGGSGASAVVHIFERG